MIKIDLHTHSILSHDGGITAEQYGSVLKKGKLDCIAITDHNDTTFAFEMEAIWGERVIVGEEISTADGDIIGLFLRKTISPGMSAEKTAGLIHEQRGLVYIPHPFETLRRAMQMDALQKIIADIDIVEVFNARSRWRGKDDDALVFAKDNDKVQASSSDSHGAPGMGSSFAIIDALPTNKTLVRLLRKGTLTKRYAPMVSYLYPAINKLRNNLKLSLRGAL